jgi:hypothetical protein
VVSGGGFALVRWLKAIDKLTGADEGQTTGIRGISQATIRMPGGAARSLANFVELPLVKAARAGQVACTGESLERRLPG